MSIYKHIFLKFCIVIFALLYAGQGHAQVLGLELLNHKDKHIINFEYSYGFILIKVKLNNILPLTFILDTGAEHVILFKKEISDILGFEYEKRINLMGSDLDKEVFAVISRGIPISIPGTKTVKRDLIILEDDFLNLQSMVGESIDGIIGSRFFRGLVLEIDYLKQQLILYNRERFKAPTEKDGYTKLDLEVVNYKPYINTEIITLGGDTVDVKLLLDSGAALPFLLFLDTHPSLILPENFIRGNLGQGLGGELEGYLSKIQELKISDDFIFKNIVTSFQEVDVNIDSSIYKNRNGLIGNPILSRFHIFLDLIKESIYLKPRKNYNKRFKYDKSGLIIYAFGRALNKYYVKDVIENSPAEEAGIRKGDIIKRVGILPANFYSLSSISHKLQRKEGKKVRFTLIRNGVKFKKTIVLRELIKDDNNP